MPKSSEDLPGEKDGVNRLMWRQRIAHGRKIWGMRAVRKIGCRSGKETCQSAHQNRKG